MYEWKFTPSADYLKQWIIDVSLSENWFQVIVAFYNDFVIIVSTGDRRKKKKQLSSLFVFL